MPAAARSKLCSSVSAWLGVFASNDQEKIRTPDLRNLEILGNIGSKHYQKRKDLNKLKAYLRRTRKLLETKLYNRNLIKGINTCVVPFVRYSGPFLKWTSEEFQQMKQRTRKFMTMHKALHPRDDVNRLYESRKRGRVFASIEDSVDASIQRLEDYIKKVLRKTDHSYKKKYRRYKYQQNKNNQKTKMGRKTTVWIFHATDKRNLTRKNWT